MTVHKQPSRIYRKARFRACFPDTTVSLRKKVSQFLEDINWQVSLWAEKP